MFVQIQIDTDTFGASDAAAIAALVDTLMAPGASVADEEQPSAPVIQMADRKAEQEAAPKPRRTRKAVAPKEPEPEPSEDAESADEDLLGDSAPTLDDAIDRATALVAEGKGKIIKAALAAVGAEKVREMDDSQVPAFLAAVEAEEAK